MINAKSSIYMFLNKFISMLIIFSFGVVVSNFYSVNDYATFILLQSIFSVLSFIYALGIDQIVYREIASNINVINFNFLKTVLKVKFVGFLIFIFIIGIIHYYLYELSFLYIFFALAFFHASKAFIVFRQSLEIRLNASVIFYSDLISIFISLLCCIIMFFNFDYELAVWWFWLVYFICSYTITSKIVKRESDGLIGESSVNLDIMKFSHEARYLLLAILMSSIFMQSDVIMLGMFSDHESVAKYGVAMSFMQPMLIIPSLVSTIILAKFIDVYKSKYDGFFVFFSSCSNLLFYLGLLVTIVIMCLSSLIVSIFYSDSYSDSSILLSLLSLSFIFIYPSSLYSKYLIVCNRTDFELYKTILAAIINIILNVILIPNYGAYGAVIASLISYAVADLLVFLAFPVDGMIVNVIKYSINPLNVVNSFVNLKGIVK